MDTAGELLHAWIRDQSIAFDMVLHYTEVET